jgi:hypothetical protein
MECRLAVCVAALALTALGCGKDSGSQAVPPQAPKVSWGSATDGIQAGLASEASTFVSGQELKFAVHLRNLETKKAKLLAGGVFGWHFVFTPAGAGISRTNRLSGADPAGAWELVLGSRGSTVVPVAIEPMWFVFSDAREGGGEPDLRALPPGKYTVTATHVTPYDPASKEAPKYWQSAGTTGPVEIEIAPDPNWRSVVIAVRDRVSGMCALKAQSHLLKEARSFVLWSLWRYDPMTKAWGEVEPRVYCSTVIMPLAEKGGAATAQDVQFLTNLTDRRGLFWAKFVEGYRESGALVFSGPALPNDLNIGPPREGFIISGVPTEDDNSCRAEYVPDPRIACVQAARPAPGKSAISGVGPLTDVNLILKWRTRKITVAEVEATKDFPKASKEWAAFKAEMKEGDELWYFRSPGPTWENKMGWEGYAIFRGNKLVRAFTTQEN